MTTPLPPLGAVGDVATVGPAPVAPDRRPGSVRRTTTIDMTWTDGFGSDLELDGHGRDLLTRTDGVTSVVADERMLVTVTPDRRISSIRTVPALEQVVQLVGERSGSGFRAVLARVLPGEVPGGGPLYLMLDDLPGATLISGFAFAQWMPVEEMLHGAGSAPARTMTGICTGFMPGSSGLAPDGSSRWTHRTRPVEPLERGADTSAWHEIRDVAEVSMRRARRLDVWFEEGEVVVDAMFQDTATRPGGGRTAVHEYTLAARADLATGLLTQVDPVPHVLPYAECPLAVLNAPSLVGTPLEELRSVVLERLRGVAGCTHLNDALRGLADVPRLAGLLAG